MVGRSTSKKDLLHLRQVFFYVDSSNYSQNMFTLNKLNKADMLRSWFSDYKSTLLGEIIAKSRKKVADEMRPILRDII